MKPLPKPPDGDFLKWAISNPEQVASYLRFVESLQRMTIVLTIDGRTIQFPLQIRENGGFFESGVNIPDTDRVLPNTWAPATGTSSRATFVTNSVSTEQLAQRFKALIDDLIDAGIAIQT